MRKICGASVTDICKISSPTRFTFSKQLVSFPGTNNETRLFVSINERCSQSASEHFRASCSSAWVVYLSFLHENFRRISCKTFYASYQYLLNFYIQTPNQCFLSRILYLQRKLILPSMVPVSTDRLPVRKSLDSATFFSFSIYANMNGLWCNKQFLVFNNCYF